MKGNLHAIGFTFQILPSPNRKSIQAKSGAGRAESSSSPQEEKLEIRVCTNRTCRKQGSLDVLQVLSGISPPYVAVKSCGCLGKCGSGPNLVILPEGVFVGNCGTPSKASNVMACLCGIDDSDIDSSGMKCLEALALRKRAEDAMERADFSAAYSLLSQAVDLKPFGGLHIIYKDRSAVRLAMGDIPGAFQDVEAALSLAPYYHDAYISKGDVLMSMNEFDAAEESYSIALELEPSVRRSRSFKAKIANLQEKLAPSNLS